ncbi:MAG: hypothetical protein E6848_13330, partial [Bradyrhizobium sp.]|nr:hypothetical protein [Bradyrhizobium sp.]
MTVVGGPEEQDRACAALSKVGDYFARGGFQIQFELTVRFVTQVELNDSSTAHQSVSGYYRANNNEILMLRANAPWTSERKPWHL